MLPPQDDATRRRILGKNKGFGIYRDPSGYLNYKGTPRKTSKPIGGRNMDASIPDPIKGKASHAPVARAAAAKAAGVAASAPSGPEIIGKYNLARAEILKGLAPQVQGIYQNAANQTAGYGKGFSDEVTSRQAAAAAGIGPGGTDWAYTGPDYSKITGDLTNLLGGYIPATSLQAQGAAMGGAAAFAPLRATQQGQYAVQEAIRGGKVSNASAAKVSASVSKLKGVLSDSYGNPILGKDGKTIPIIQSGSASLVDPKTGLTPYQTQSLSLREQSMAATKARTEKGFVFKTKQQAATARKAANQIDWTTTKNLNDGHVHLKSGGILLDAHRRAVTWTPKQAAAAQTKPGKVSNSDFGKAVGEAHRLVGLSSNPMFGKDVMWVNNGKIQMVQQGKYLADPRYKTKVYGNGTGKPLTTNNPRYALRESKMTFPNAVTYLMTRYGLTRKQARTALISAGGKP